LRPWAALFFRFVGQLTIANWASLSYLGKMKFGKMQGQRIPACGPDSFWVCRSCLGWGGVILFSGPLDGNPWLPAEIFAVLAAALSAVMLSSLDSFTQLAEKKKEILIDALAADP